MGSTSSWGSRNVMTRSGLSCGGPGHDGEEPQRRCVLGSDGNDGYVAQSSKGREGNEGEAHGETDERLSGSGEAWRRQGDDGDLRWPCREDELDDEASGCPGSCGSA